MPRDTDLSGVARREGRARLSCGIACVRRHLRGP